MDELGKIVPTFEKAITFHGYTLEEVLKYIEISINLGLDDLAIFFIVEVDLFTQILKIEPSKIIYKTKEKSLKAEDCLEFVKYTRHRLLALLVKICVGEFTSSSPLLIPLLSETVKTLSEELAGGLKERISLIKCCMTMMNSESSLVVKDIFNTYFSDDHYIAKVTEDKNISGSAYQQSEVVNGIGKEYYSKAFELKNVTSVKFLVDGFVTELIKGSEGVFLFFRSMIGELGTLKCCEFIFSVLSDYIGIANEKLTQCLNIMKNEFYSFVKEDEIKILICISSIFLVIKYGKVLYDTEETDLWKDISLPKDLRIDNKCVIELYGGFKACEKLDPRKQFLEILKNIGYKNIENFVFSKKEVLIENERFRKIDIYISLIDENSQKNLESETEKIFNNISISRDVVKKDIYRGYRETSEIVMEQKESRPVFYFVGSKKDSAAVCFSMPHYFFSDSYNTAIFVNKIKAFFQGLSFCEVSLARLFEIEYDLPGLDKEEIFSVKFSNFTKSKILEKPYLSFEDLEGDFAPLDYKRVKNKTLIKGILLAYCFRFIFEIDMAEYPFFVDYKSHKVFSFSDQKVFSGKNKYLKGGKLPLKSVEKQFLNMWFEEEREDIVESLKNWRAIIGKNISPIAKCLTFISTGNWTKIVFSNIELLLKNLQKGNYML